MSFNPSQALGITLALLPAGSTITVNAVNGTYPVRPTSRINIIVRWRGPTAPPIGGTGAVNNVDEWLATP